MTRSAEQQGSDEWLEARRPYESASQIAALSGEHPRLSTAKYVRQRVRQLARAESEFKMVPAVEHGTKMEPYARRYLEELKNVKIRETGFIVHPDYDFIGASPDGMIGLDAICEFKCPYPLYTKKPYSIFDASKRMYKVQVEMQMACTDTDFCYFFCFLAKGPNDKNPQVKLEKIIRDENFLIEPLEGSLLPRKRKGKVSRIDLYQEWHLHILDEFNDEGRRQKHLDPLDQAKLVSKDANLKMLTAYQAELHSVRARIADELEAISRLTTQSDELKRAIGEQYKESVTDGRTTVRVIHKTPSVDFRKAFESVNGEALLEQAGDNLESFRRTTGAMQISIRNEEDA